MNLGEALAQVTLRARATPTKTLVGGDRIVGLDFYRNVFPDDTDIAYSFHIQSGGVGSATQLTLTSGTTFASGSPTISDGDGNDFEGIAFPTMVTLFGVAAQAPATNAAFLTITSTGAGRPYPETDLDPGGTICQTWENGFVLASDTWNFSVGANDEVTVTVIGRGAQTFALLRESGSNLLLEEGSRILLE